MVSLTDIERGVLLLDVVVDVGHAKRLHRGGSYSQQDLGPDQQQVHHVGVGFVATHFVLHQLGLLAGGVQAHVAPGVRPQRLHVLVVFRQELGQSGEERAERHHDAPAADQTGPVGLGPEVADEQDQGQVADLKAAGDHPDVGALEVEAALQGGQNAHLREGGDTGTMGHRSVITERGKGKAWLLVVGGVITSSNVCI